MKKIFNLIVQNFYSVKQKNQTRKPSSDYAAATGKLGWPENLNVANHSDSSSDLNMSFDQQQMLWDSEAWDSVATFDQHFLESQPGRAELALFAAAALLQQKKIDEASVFLRLARAWGGDRELIARVLIYSTYKSLESARLLIGKKHCPTISLPDFSTSPHPLKNFAYYSKRQSKKRDIQPQLNRSIDDKSINNISGILQTYDAKTALIKIKAILSSARHSLLKKKFNPEVSIVLPFFNNSESIERCILSISKQSYSSYEVILINDGSTDDTAWLASSICKKYIKEWKLINHDRNKGVAAARNTGLEYATGNFIRFIDADDFIDIDSLAILAENSSDQDIIRGGVATYKDGSAKFDIVTNEPLLNLAPATLPVTCQIKFLYGITAMLFRRAYIRECELKFNENLRNAEDTYFLVDAFLTASRVTVLPEVVYNYCKRENSLSNPSEPGLSYFLNITSRLSYLAERFEEAKLLETSAAAFQATWKFYLKPQIIPLAEKHLGTSDLREFLASIELLQRKFQD